MNDLTIDYLIPTFGERVLDVVDALEEPRPGIGFVICHQGPAVDRARIGWINRDDVLYRDFPNEAGISKNRNHAIGLSRADICVLIDDDCRLAEDADERVRSEHRRFPDAGLVLFQTLDHLGSLRRKYPRAGHRYSRLQSFHASTVEITFRRAAVLARGLAFDERFGVGSRFGFGEDPLFVADAIASGLKVVQGMGNYAGTVEVSTGERLETKLSPGALRTLGAIASRKWGVLAPAAIGKEAVRLKASGLCPGLSLSEIHGTLRSGMSECRSMPRNDTGILAVSSNGGL